MIVPKSVIPCITGQAYAPWINSNNTQELQQGTIYSDSGDWLKNQIISTATWLWDGTVHCSFWITCIGCSILILYWYITKSKKCLQGFGALILTDILINSIDSCCR